MKSENNLDNNINELINKMFHDPIKANRAYENLLNNGYKEEDINIIMSDKTRDNYFSNKDIDVSNLGSKATEGMGIGGTIGGIIGAAAAAVAAMGTVLAFPGLGLVIAGPLAASFAGAGAGGALGTLIGALTGAGIPSDQAAIYENDIKNGGVLISVKPSGNNRSVLESILNN